MVITFSKLNNSEKHIQSRFVIGIVLSVLIHLIILFGVLKHVDDIKEKSADAVKSPIEVTLMAPPKPTVNTPQPPTPVQKPAVPQPPKPAVQPKPKAEPVKKAAPAVKHTQRPAPLRLPSDLPLPNQQQAISPDIDMSKMLDQAREKREELAQQESESRPKAPTANEIAKANIDFEMNRNKYGKNGIFSIINKGPRIATYAFFGWDKERRDARKQIITVDAGLNGDVDLAIINSMITIIRKYYTGNFNWDSDRLGRVIVLSARPEDTKGLQDFLRQEMFSGR